jgi:hypothetical protein
MEEPEEKKSEEVEFVIDAVFDGGLELIFEVFGEIISGVTDGL